MNYERVHSEGMDVCKYESVYGCESMVNEKSGCVCVCFLHTLA